MEIYQNSFLAVLIVLATQVGTWRKEQINDDNDYYYENRETLRVDRICYSYSPAAIHQVL